VYSQISLVSLTGLSPNFSDDVLQGRDRGACVICLNQSETHQPLQKYHGSSRTIPTISGLGRLLDYRPRPGSRRNCGSRPQLTRMMAVDREAMQNWMLHTIASIEIHAPEYPHTIIPK
jgi:hypothetical protein